MSAAQKLRQEAQDRFTPNGGGFVYRRSEGAPGVAVSAAERDAYLQACFARIARVTWVVNGWVVLGTLGLVLYLTSRATSAGWARLLAFVLVLLVFGTLQMLALPRPPRGWQRRPPVDAGLPGPECQRRRLARKTWLRVVWDVVFTAICIFNTYNARDLGPAARAVLVVLSVLALMACIDDLLTKGVRAVRRRDATTA